MNKTKYDLVTASNKKTRNLSGISFSRSTRKLKLYLRPRLSPMVIPVLLFIHKDFVEEQQNKSR
jgi:hypothetical protein